MFWFSRNGLVASYCRFRARSPSCQLKELIETAVVGRGYGNALDILDSAAFEAIRAEPLQRKRLAMLARLSRSILERAGPVHAVIRNTAAVDEEVGALRLEQQALRLRAQTEFVRALAEAGPLRDGLTVEEGGVHYWILAAPELQHVLVAEQGWSFDQYEDWLRTVLDLTLLPRGTEGSGA